VFEKLRKKLEEFREMRRPGRRRGAGLVEYLIGLMVIIILAVGVVIPAVQDTINHANITGTAATILGYVPLMIVIGIFVLATRLTTGGE